MKTFNVTTFLNGKQYLQSIVARHRGEVSDRIKLYAGERILKIFEVVPSGD